MSETNLPADAVELDDNGNPKTASSIGLTPEAKKPTKLSWTAKVPIDVELPDGRIITFSPPNQSLSEKLASILAEISYADTQTMSLERQRVRMLLYVTHINSVVKPMIGDPIGRAALEQELTDEFLDLLFVTWAENFGTGSVDLKVTKKS